MSVLGVLGVIFVTLKLLGVIAWSWWLVLAPFYLIPVIFILLLIFTGGVLAGVGALMNRGERRRPY